MALSSNVERTPEEMNAALARRVESLVSDLLVIDGMTKRGAMLSAKYRVEELPAIRRFVLRIFDALDDGAPAQQPWNREQTDAS
jgi:hypothetical protein